ncbi:uncharacterized protein LOC132565037 [Ylistrum balloti]|uniref:uncharacterized protein LOC132565037 n=1 Tax=Ylistrum balloti TaxID=509963 RepID=UPI002905B7A4|nr:uncharacterized protein LOC132565037 [Ylistrum balloti]
MAVTLCRTTKMTIVRRFTLQNLSRHEKQFCTDGITKLKPHGLSRRIKIGNIDIAPWTCAGLESCVVVGLSVGNSKSLQLAFDMGYACQTSVPCSHVFISHGHMDHCSAINQHASKRSLVNLPPAKYYLGNDVIAPMHVIHENFQKISEFPFKADLIVAKPNESIKLPGPYHVVPFKTFHRVPSMGFLLYKTISQIKDKFSKHSWNELRDLEQRGEQIYEQTVIPELAYTGDTTFEVFLKPPIADILKVKVLITECTYINTYKNINEAMTRERGHIHLHEIIRNPHIFSKVGNLMLVHFSNRYRADDISRTIERLCPAELKQKLYSASVHQEETYITSY